MSSATSGHALADALRARFGDAVVGSDELAARVTPESIRDVCAYLRDEPANDYKLLNAITAVDYVEYFEMVYHLTSIERNATAVLKAKVYGRDTPEVPSVVSVWKGAELQEREVYDLMGVAFEGHPDLRRLLLWEGFEGHPLRRDYLEPPLPYKWPHGG